MTHRAWLVAILVSTVSVAACGKDEKTPTVFNKPGDDDDGGQDATDDGPGPRVEITSPKPATDPNADEVLTSAKVTVHCTAFRGQGVRASDVDPSSVRITARDPLTKTVLMTATKALEDGEYEAKFDVGAFSNGAVEFTCEAADIDGNVKEKTITTLLDLGPEIEIIEPKNGSVRSLVSPTAIQFRVKPSKLTEKDTEAAVKKIDLRVAGQTIVFTEASPQLYQASVNFQDQALFGNAPTAAAIAVTASNRRTPEPAVREVVSKIDIDSQGPNIKITSPVHLNIVRAIVTISADISDAAGIEPGSVVANINDDAKVITEWKTAGNVYSQTFNTLDFSLELTQLTINVTAYDTVGNVAVESVVIRLDNVGPLVSMDPPWIREHKKGSRVCSVAYDPLWDAASDGEDSLGSPRLRAMVEDRTNTPKEGTRYNSLVDPSSVEIFVQSNTDIPLLIDADGDGKCDEINYKDLEMMKRPVREDLDPVMKAGTAWFTSDTAEYNSPEHDGAKWTYGPCTVPKTAGARPTAICPWANGAYRIPPSRIEGGAIPVVYAFSPTGGASGECIGANWEVLGFVDSGWYCVAVRAEDHVGNVGVSRPLRLCLGGGCAGDPPDCLDGCTLPDEFDKNDVRLSE